MLKYLMCKDNDAILMFDSAYEAFISTEDTVKSIYEIEGAREVAIEFRSFSKTAGFTGTRCAYAVVPKEVTGKTKSGDRQPLNPLMFPWVNLSMLRGPSRLS